MPHPENSPTGKPDVSPPSQRRYFLAQYEVENEPSQALEELCSHSPLFSLVLQNTPLVLIYIDRYRTIRFAEGKGIEGLRKLTVEEWIGQPFEEIFDEGEGIQKAVERGLKDETINTVIQTGPFSLEFHVLPVKDESGQVVGVFGIATNITERFLYHQALQESEQRFEAIFEHLTIGVMLQTLEGELLDCNTAIQQMLGGTCKDLRQQNLVEYVHPADRPALVSAYTDLVQSKHAEFQKEIRVKDKGAGAWARITASVVKSSLGEPLFIVSLIEESAKINKSPWKNARSNAGCCKAVSRSGWPWPRSCTTAPCKTSSAFRTPWKPSTRKAFPPPSPTPSSRSSGHWTS